MLKFITCRHALMLNARKNEPQPDQFSLVSFMFSQIFMCSVYAILARQCVEVRKKNGSLTDFVSHFNEPFVR